MYNPDDVACEHGYLYPSVGGMTPCPHPHCGEDDDEPNRHADGSPAGEA